MMRAGFGYQFNKKLVGSFNLGYDYHHEYEIEAIPTYILVKYNIWSEMGMLFLLNMAKEKCGDTPPSFQMETTILLESVGK
jgi:hypothetical protein